MSNSPRLLLELTEICDMTYCAFRTLLQANKHEWTEDKYRSSSNKNWRFFGNKLETTVGGQADPASYGKLPLQFLFAGQWKGTQDHLHSKQGVRMLEYTCIVEVKAKATVVSTIMVLYPVCFDPFDDQFATQALHPTLSPTSKQSWNW